LGTFFLFQACKKETGGNFKKGNNSLQTSEKMTSRNGRLIFKDSLTFINHLVWIFNNQENTKKIIDFNNKKGITSMADIYYRGMNIDSINEFKSFLELYPYSFFKENIEESEFYELPAPNVLSFIANEYGIYQIGKTIYRITFNHLLKITDGNESLIPILFRPIEEIDNKKI